jgi:hypothetical protein
MNRKGICCNQEISMSRQQHRERGVNREQATYIFCYDWQFALAFVHVVLQINARAPLWSRAPSVVKYDAVEFQRVWVDLAICTAV